MSTTPRMYDALCTMYCLAHFQTCASCGGKLAEVHVPGELVTGKNGLTYARRRRRRPKPPFTQRTLAAFVEDLENPLNTEVSKGWRKKKVLREQRSHQLEAGSGANVVLWGVKACSSKQCLGSLQESQRRYLNRDRNASLGILHRGINMDRGIKPPANIYRD